MKAMDKIIGYSSIKRELGQISDTLKNREAYDKLGVSSPRGLLLYGEPGVGKSLMAAAIIEESGRPAYICRKDKPNGDFVKYIKETFDKAAENAPSIVFLDDMDKFTANEKSREEYVAVQTCIDSVKGEKVFVVATINESKNIPESLLRAGRFDRRIKMAVPRGKDSYNIISYFMDKKGFLPETNRDDVAKMLEGNTCAELETVINEASIYAGYERKEKIELEHLVKAYLRQSFDFDAFEEETDPEELEMVAYHEAGHLIVLDIIKEGSVGLASVSSQNGGFVKRCERLKRRPHEVLVALAGKAAAELKFGWVASGAQSDIRKATHLVDDGYGDSATGGFALVDIGRFHESPESAYQRETVAAARTEEYLFKAKEIIAANMEYLERVAKALMEKRVLLNSDVKKIRESVVIKRVDIA